MLPILVRNTSATLGSSSLAMSNLPRGFFVLAVPSELQFDGHHHSALVTQMLASRNVLVSGLVMLEFNVYGARMLSIWLWVSPSGAWHLVLLETLCD